jgi:hypothetical protein
MRKGLLHVLHAGGLDRDDSGCFERLRNKNNLYGSFLPRFEEVHVTGDFGIETPTWRSVIPVGEKLFQARRPFTLVKLRVASKPVSRRPGTMSRNERYFVDFVFHFREDIAE